MAPATRPLKSPRPSFRTYAAPACALALLSATVLLSGCGSFFSCEGKADCPACVSTSSVNCVSTGTGTSGSGSSTDDFAYVTNSTTNSTSVSAYNIGSGALTAVSGSPFNFDYSPNALVVTPKDNFLYAATDPNLGTGYIYGYSVSSAGVLANISSSPQITENDAALAVSPDSQWLFTLPITTLPGANLINVYPINATTGDLGSLQTDLPLSGASTGTITPLAVAVAPSGAYVAAALSTGGANVFPFDTTTGSQTANQSGVVINPGASTNGIYALAFDTNNYLYCATTNGLQVFSVTSGATVTAVGSAYTLGTSPRSIAIASTTANSVTTPNYVFIGDEVSAKIYAYAIGTNAALTAVSGSPFNAPTGVNSLAVDSTGKYLIASGYDTSAGTQLFTIGSGGVLTTSATAGTGTTTTIPGAIATTH